MVLDTSREVGDGAELRWCSKSEKLEVMEVHESDKRGVAFQHWLGG